MKQKKVLVTGGAGYIGAHTVAELNEAGYEAVIIDNLSRSDRTLLQGLENVMGKAPVFYEGDCADRSFLRSVFEDAGPFESVVHFAAFKSVGESVREPLIYYHNNLGSMIALLEVMHEKKIRDIIFSSSCTVYGQPDVIPVNESAPFKRAESPYGATKQMSERILEDAVVKGFRIVSLRYFNPIGAHPSALLGELPIGPPNNLAPYITQTASGLRKNLTIFGNDYQTPDGTCIRDYIHVTDLAIAHVKALEYLASQKQESLFEAFNLGTGVGVSVMQLVNEFIKATGVNIPYTIGPRRPGDVEKVYADPSKANRSLGWKPKFSIRDSLLHGWKWEKKIRNIN
jgi:UDP-glucose 4-epimerase